MWTDAVNLFPLRHGADRAGDGRTPDTVKPYNEYENTGDGFSFANYNGDEMLGVINYSKHIYFDRKKQWNQMIDRGMANDYSWNNSKGRYEGLYRYLLGEV